jgi:hypothetical protein
VTTHQTRSSVPVIRSGRDRQCRCSRPISPSKRSCVCGAKLPWRICMQDTGSDEFEDTNTSKPIPARDDASVLRQHFDQPNRVRQPRSKPPPRGSLADVVHVHGGASSNAEARQGPPRCRKPTCTNSRGNPANGKTATPKPNQHTVRKAGDVAPCEARLRKAQRKEGGDIHNPNRPSAIRRFGGTSAPASPDAWSAVTRRRGTTQQSPRPPRKALQHACSDSNNVFTK